MKVCVRNLSAQKVSQSHSPSKAVTGSLNIMQWNKKRGFVYQSTLYVCCWWQCTCSTLRWEQLHARKGNSLTLPTSTAGCATLLTEKLTESLKSKRGALPLYDIQIYRKYPVIVSKKKWCWGCWELKRMRKWTTVKRLVNSVAVEQQIKQTCSNEQPLNKCHRICIVWDILLSHWEPTSLSANIDRLPKPNIRL